MRRLLPLVALLPLAAAAEIKDRIAAVVNGQPITLSEVEERVGPELAQSMDEIRPLSHSLPSAAPGFASIRTCKKAARPWRFARCRRVCPR